MTDESAVPNGNSAKAPDPVVEKGRGLSLIWVIPIVAILVGGYIGFDAIKNRGVHVVINLPTAEWVEAGKTSIRYLEVDVGTVDEVVLNETHDGVELHCTLHKGTKKHLTEGAAFWLVHPRVGAGGVSGLGTLLSGAYLAMRLGPLDGAAKEVFEGLDVPPLESEISPALTITLHSEELKSLDVGSPIYFREVQVGKVEGHAIDEDGSGVSLNLYFPPEHADLVREDSRFWNAGGIQVSGNLANLQVETESLDSILSGGIAFDSPRGDQAKPAPMGAEFWLHPSNAEVATYPFHYGGLQIYVESSQLGSLAIGALVYYREIPVGAVISQELMNDSKHVRVGLNIQKRYAALVRSNSVFWNASGISAEIGIHGLKIHTESLAAILSGGVAFATPDSPGDPVKAGSVFRLHDEIKDEWLGWSPLIWRGPPGEAPPEAAAKDEAGGESGLARFFHHGQKSEEDSKKAGESNKDAKQAAAHEKKRHGFFSGLFHRGSD